MVNSINTNLGASIALQNLTGVQKTLAKNQAHITTGNKINGPKDDAATFAIAQELLGTIGGTHALRSGFDSAGSILDVSLVAAQSVSDLLVEMKGLAVQGLQPGLDAEGRQALETQFNSLKDQITTIVDSASFNGSNLLEQGASDLTVLTGEDGGSFTVSAQDFSGDGLGISGLDLSSIENAETALAELNLAIESSGAMLADLGSASNRVDAQNDFTTKLRDILTAGVGNLVDADLSEEAAGLTANQVKEALGTKALGIANSAPTFLQTLFNQE